MTLRYFVFWLSVGTTLSGDVITMSGAAAAAPAPSRASSAERAVPLVVDLDGTLARTDTLHEALLALAAARPLRLAAAAGWLMEGRAGFKSRLAAEALADPEGMPLREGVMGLVREAREAGRRVLLVSGADARQVEAVARHTGLFDEVAGSEEGRNLTGADKARWLVDRFGEGGFDYVGDSRADLAVWPHARRAFAAGAGAAMRRRIEAAGIEAHHLDPADGLGPRARAHLRAMRPHQWLKNLLVFAPVLAAHDPGALMPAALAFLAFSLAASAVYLLNDMLDLSADRRHPRKRLRPFAAGSIPLRDGALQAAGLLLACGLIALMLPPLFGAVLAGYLVLTTAYSFVLKRKLMIDIWALGALYTIRIIGGGAAAGVPLSEWMLAFSMFLFLSLAAVKRQSELADLAASGASWSAGRGYGVADRPVVLGVVLSAGYCSVLVLALYISSADVSGLYGRAEALWLICPLLLYWISRATVVSYRGQMDDDPIVYALRDRVSLIVLALAVALVLASMPL